VIENESMVGDSVVAVGALILGFYLGMTHTEAKYDSVKGKVWVEADFQLKCMLVKLSTIQHSALSGTQLNFFYHSTYRFMN